MTVTRGQKVLMTDDEGYWWRRGGKRGLVTGRVVREDTSG